MPTNWDDPSDDEEEHIHGEAQVEAQDRNETAIQNILGSLFSMQSGASLRASGGADRRTDGLSGISLQTLSRILFNTPRAFETSVEEDHDEDEGDDDDDDDGDEPSYDTSFHRPMYSWFSPHTEPQKEGVELLLSGDFGSVGLKINAVRKNLNITRSLLGRPHHPMPASYQEQYSNNLVPNTNGTSVATYESNVYTAQFSADSSFYYTCAQDFRLHIFDMTAPRPPQASSSPPHPGLKSNMAVKNVIQGHPGRWTVTDANLSPDNERMIYSSITPTVYMTCTSPGESSAQIPIPFADPPSRRGYNFGDGEFGIWSCRFSADGNEVVAGGSGNIFVYDLLANRRTVKISAHADDVNSCCWADTSSGNVLVSASDDTFIKIWDRRSLNTSQKPSGVLIGHTEGITYVSAKGDGRYVISNGKDQALRLWDLREMRSSHEFEAVEGRSYGSVNFDYRYPYYPKPKYKAHPQDCSVMTYRGHHVFRTLIRCHFSPGDTTGGQYIYSGSSDGKIHIWSLDGRIIQVLDRSKTLPRSFDPSEPEFDAISGARSNNCVRDVSWHSQEPFILSAGWNDARGGTVIARHEWKGLMKMPGALEDWVEKNQQEAIDSLNNRRRSGRLQDLAHRRARTGQYVPSASSSSDDDED